MRWVRVDTIQFGVDTIIVCLFLKKSTNKQRLIMLNYRDTPYITFMFLLQTSSPNTFRQQPISFSTPVSFSHHETTLVDASPPTYFTECALGNDPSLSLPQSPLTTTELRWQTIR
jgi:hypothetical protein